MSDRPPSGHRDRLRVSQRERHPAARDDAGGDAHGIAARLALAERVEQAALDVLRTAKPGRSLETNVEFYTALLLEAAGFPAEAVTFVHAMSRTAGWVAHAREQQATGRLIRPQSRYVGPAVDAREEALAAR